MVTDHVSVEETTYSGFRSSHAPQAPSLTSAPHTDYRILYPWGCSAPVSTPSLPPQPPLSAWITFSILEGWAWLLLQARSLPRLHQHYPGRRGSQSVWFRWPSGLVSSELLHTGLQPAASLSAPSPGRALLREGAHVSWGLSQGPRAS